MNRAKTLPAILTIIEITVLILPILPVHANTPPPWTLSLDAYSTSTLDATIEFSHTLTTSFNIGAIINASNNFPIDNVRGWQFSIVYDNATVAPGVDPNGPMNGVQLGAQLGNGNPGWAARYSSQTALMVSNIISVDSTHRKVLIGLVLTGQNPVTIGPTLSPTVQGNLLASVNFTVIHQTTGDLAFSIADLKFADNSSQIIPNIVQGPSVIETAASNQNPTTTTTQLINDATGLAPSGTEAAGSSFHDTSRIVGVSGSPPSGTMTYQYFVTGDCSGSFTPQVVALSGGLSPDSDSTGPLSAGSYSYKAVYGGDSNYLGSTSPCEQFTVKQATVQNPPSVPLLYIIAPLAIAAILAILAILVVKNRKSRGSNRATPTRLRFEAAANDNS